MSLLNLSPMAPDAKGNFTELKEFETNLLQPNQWYTININPDDDHQFFYHPTRGDEFTKNMSKYVNKLKSSNKLTLFLENSEPTDQTKRSRLHMHGVIRFSPTGLCKWYMLHRNLLNKFNHVTIYPIKNAETWFNYCTKDEYFMKNVFCPYFHLSYPLFNTSESWTEFTLTLKDKPIHNNINAKRQNKTQTLLQKKSKKRKMEYSKPTPPT